VSPDRRGLQGPPEYPGPRAPAASPDPWESRGCRGRRECPESRDALVRQAKRVRPDRRVRRDDPDCPAHQDYLASLASADYPDYRACLA